MTEASYQAVRKLMQQLAYLKGLISGAKRDVAKWTRLEYAATQHLKMNSAEAYRTKIHEAMERLDRYRAMFAAIQLPPSDMPASMINERLCRICQTPIPIKNDSDYCVTCEDNTAIPKLEYAQKKNNETED